MSRFHLLPLPLSLVPIPLPSYSPTSIKGIALQGEILALIAKGAVKLDPLSPGFYNRLFVVQKASGSWRPVIDLSHLNKFVFQTRFKMKSNQSVLRSVQKFDWVVSIDVKDAYLQVPVHPDSRKFLWWVVDGTVYQFWALCFGLSMAPQVFTEVNGSGVSHASLYWRQDASVSRRLAHSSLVPFGGSAGEGQSSRILSYSRYCRQPGEILSGAISDSNISGYVLSEPLFWGFSHREVSVNLARAD